MYDHQDQQFHCLVLPSSASNPDPYFDFKKVIPSVQTSCLQYHFPSRASYDYVYTSVATLPIQLTILFPDIYSIIEYECGYELSEAEEQSHQDWLHSLHGASNFGETSFNPGFFELIKTPQSGTYLYTMIVQYHFDKRSKVEITVNVAECTCGDFIDLPDLGPFALTYGQDFLAMESFDPFLLQRERICGSTCGLYGLDFEVNTGLSPSEANVGFQSIKSSDAYCTSECFEVSAAGGAYPTTFFPTTETKYYYDMVAYQIDSGSGDHTNASVKQTNTIEVTVTGDCPTYKTKVVLYHFWDPTAASWDSQVPLDGIIDSGGGQDATCPSYSLQTSVAPGSVLNFDDPIDWGTDSWTAGFINLSSSAQNGYHHEYFTITLTEPGSQRQPLDIEVELHVAEQNPSCADLPTLMGLVAQTQVLFSEIESYWSYKEAPEQDWHVVPISYENPRSDSLNLIQRLKNCIATHPTQYDYVDVNLVQASDSEGTLASSFGPNLYKGAFLDITSQGAAPYRVSAQELAFDFCTSRELTFSWTYEGSGQDSSSGENVFLMTNDLQVEVLLFPHQLDGSEDPLLAFNPSHSLEVDNLHFYLASLDDKASSVRLKSVSYEVSLPELLPPPNPHCTEQVREITLEFQGAEQLGSDWYALETLSYGQLLRIDTGTVGVLSLIEDLTVEAQLKYEDRAADSSVTASETLDFSIFFEVQACVKAEMVFDLSQTGGMSDVTIPVVKEEISQSLIQKSTKEADSASTQSIDQAVDALSEGNNQEDERDSILVSLPEPISISPGCDTYVRQTLTFDQAAFDLGTNWYDAKLAESQLFIDPSVVEIQALEGSRTIEATLKAELVDRIDPELVYSSTNYQFTIQLSVAESEDLDRADFNPSSSLSQETATYNSSSESAEDAAEEKVSKVQPIKSVVKEAAITGGIEIRFTRPVTYLFSPDKRILEDELPLDKGDGLKEQYLSDLKAAITIKLVEAKDLQEYRPAIDFYNVTDFGSQSLTLQVSYANAQSISYDAVEPDALLINFDPQVFREASESEPAGLVVSVLPLLVDLPRQIDSSVAAQVEQTIKSIQSAGALVATSNVLVNFLLGVSLKALWKMISTLQFVVFFHSWKAQMPPNASIAIETFKAIALGEFIPYEWLTEPILDFFEGSAEDLSQKEAKLRAQSNVLANMGVALVIILIVALLIALVVCCARQVKKDGKVHKLVLNLKAKLMWNTLLRTCLQSYLAWTISCLFAVSMLDFGTGLSTFNSLLTLAVLTVTASLPFVFGATLYRNNENLENPKIKGTIGTLYLGIRTTKVETLASSTVFMARRFIFACITVMFLEVPHICIHVFLVSNVLTACYDVHSRAHDSMLAHRVELLNELGLQLVTYHILVFPLMLSPNDEEAMGSSMISFVCLIFLGNLLVMIWGNRAEAKRRLRLKKAKVKAAQEMRLREHRRKEAELEEFKFHEENARAMALAVPDHDIDGEVEDEDVKSEEAEEEGQRLSQVEVDAISDKREKINVIAKQIVHTLDQFGGSSSYNRPATSLVTAKTSGKVPKKRLSDVVVAGLPEKSESANLSELLASSVQSARVSYDRNRFMQDPSEDDEAFVQQYLNEISSEGLDPELRKQQDGALSDISLFTIGDNKKAKQQQSESVESLHEKEPSLLDISLASREDLAYGIDRRLGLPSPKDDIFEHKRSDSWPSEF